MTWALFQQQGERRTNLTVAVQAHPSATDEQLAAIRGTIATWDRVLRRCFDGLITLTDVTGAKRKTADIVVHYVPTAGGVVFGGHAICGAHRCPNILVRSDLPPSLDREPYTPEYLGLVTLHPGPGRRRAVPARRRSLRLLARLTSGPVEAGEASNPPGSAGPELAAGVTRRGCFSLFPC